MSYLKRFLSAYPLRTAAIAVAAAAGLSGCTTPYGYSGVSLGYGSGYGPYAGYGYGYPNYGYSRLGYGYSPYWGWYDNFYYPGTGYYVYDSYRRPHRWTHAQRRYWSVRRERALRDGGKRVIFRDNWDDFDRQRAKSRSHHRIERSVSQPARIKRHNRPAWVERSKVNSERHKIRTERGKFRAERSKVRTERKAARELRRSEQRAEKEDRSKGRGRSQKQQEQ